MQNNYPERKRTRLKNFDYNSTGAYFITICTENRQCLLSKILHPSVGGDVLDAPSTDGLISSVGGDVLDAPSTDGLISSVGGDVLDAPKYSHRMNIQLSNYGLIADKYINQLRCFYDNINIDSYVIMPNHIHILLTVKNTYNLLDGASRTSPPTKQHSTVSKFVSTFKRFCNKEYGKNIWQRHFYDHIIRDIDDYGAHKKYIFENPVAWHFDELFSE